MRTFLLLVAVWSMLFAIFFLAFSILLGRPRKRSTPVEVFTEENPNKKVIEVSFDQEKGIYTIKNSHYNRVVDEERQELINSVLRYRLEWDENTQTYRKKEGIPPEESEIITK